MDNLFIFCSYFIHLVAVETRSIVEIAIDEPNVKDGVVKLLAELDK